MLKKIFIYGVGTFFSKILVFLLLPSCKHSYFLFILQGRKGFAVYDAYKRTVFPLVAFLEANDSEFLSRF